MSLNVLTGTGATRAPANIARGWNKSHKGPVMVEFAHDSTHQAFIRRPQMGMVLALVVGTGGGVTEGYIVQRDMQGYPLRQLAYNRVRAPVGESAPHVRSPLGNLERVREVFKPSVTALAHLCGVSRQTVYNWQAGQPVAQQNESKLEQLAAAADLLAAAHLGNDAGALRRKLPGGLTVFQAVAAGQSANDAVTTLVAMITKELDQRKMLADRLSQRKAKTFDISDVGTPHLLD